MDTGDVTADAKLGIELLKSDLEPQIISHLPALAHAALVAGNGIGNEQHSLRLIGLAKGAEAKLAAVVGQQRVSAIGIKSGSELLDPILEKVRAELPAPLVPWIGTEKDNKKHDLHKLAVRELHTTAPIKTSKSQQQQKQPKDKSHAQSV
ncbi:hypothetical protein GGI07_001218 [Coemansia sp. Benny D115]|nr:hypothetical protein GGI07_001218 [Coemansia sp. Benny D115]